MYGKNVHPPIPWMKLNFQYWRRKSKGTVTFASKDVPYRNHKISGRSQQFVSTAIPTANRQTFVRHSSMCQTMQTDIRFTTLPAFVQLAVNVLRSI